MLHGHGDGYRRTSETVADFSSNAWYGGEPAGLKEYVFSQWPRLNRYPEILAESLVVRAAAHHGVAPSLVMMSSGTTETIYLVAQAWARRRSTVVTPAFAEYEDAGRLHDYQLTFLAWKDLRADPRTSSNLVFVCNPNNPTDSVLGPRVLETLLGQQPAHGVRAR